jgi:hypothetical protein
MPEVESSVIRWIEYDEDEHALFITFTSGLTYRYERFPQIEYDALLSAPSKGEFFNQRIKDSYAFDQVNA